MHGERGRQRVQSIERHCLSTTHCGLPTCSVTVSTPVNGDRSRSDLLRPPHRGPERIPAGIRQQLQALAARLGQIRRGGSRPRICANRRGRHRTPLPETRAAAVGIQ